MTVRPKEISLQHMLLLIVGALTLLIAGLSLKDVYLNTQRLGDISKLREASALGDQLFGAVETLSLERDIVLSMLHATDSYMIEELRPRLAEARQGADTTMAEALTALDSYNFSELAGLRARIESRIAIVRLLRPRVDAAIDQPAAERQPDLAAHWDRDLTALVDDTQTLWVDFTGHFVNVDPTVTMHLRYKNVLRRITYTTERERSLVGRLLAENRGPTPQQVAELLRGQGATEQNWAAGRTLAQQSGIYPEVAPYFADAESHYATMRDMMQDSFYSPIVRRAEPYPISPDLWFELSTQATETFDALRQISIEATNSYLDELIARARAAIVAQALVFLFALLLCGLCFWVIIGRVIRPVNEIVDALTRATRGEKVEFTTRRRDEIGKLGDVLQVFQETVDEVRRTAAELDHSERRLRAVVDNAVDGLITMDGAGMVTAFNPAAERLFGYQSIEIIGRNVRTLLPDDEADPASLREDAPPRETSGRRKDGSTFPIDLAVSTFTLDAGRYFLGIVRDITLRRQAEQALASYTQALERSNKELDDFAYIASHDLKEPLRGIHNHARFLLEDNADKLDEESIKRLDRLVQLSQRMERLVNDLLYFSRLGRQDLAIQPTEIGAVIHDIESTLADFLEQKGARILAPEPLPMIVCDKPRVTELFRNLITNGVKYNDKPDRIVEIGHLTNKATPDGATARDVFFVRDNGLGIDPEFHEDIFRIFKRLQAATSPEDGTGVGLTFVKKIVERHGGRIWLESEIDKGTTFFFTLEPTRDERRVNTKAA